MVIDEVQLVTQWSGIVKELWDEDSWNKLDLRVLLARAKTDHFDVSWWRDGNNEVDFVLSQGDRVLGIEVKSGRIKGTKGMTQFVNRFLHAKTEVVGSQGCSIEQFLAGEVPLFS